jgi:hypothetical protein
MPQIFELFGFPLSDNSEAAKASRRSAICPFMGRKCDGGGNRYSSHLVLANLPGVKKLYQDSDILAAGVCSIKLTAAGDPWIVCPRRLMALSREREKDTHQGNTESKILNLLGYPAGTRVGVWSEVKLKYNEEVKQRAAVVRKKFDYTFDYILVPLKRFSMQEAEEATGLTHRVLERHLKASGHTISQRDGRSFVEDFPAGPPAVIEIMTSSTSGGNKKIRTTIANAFEDALLGKEHKAPGINYRQVWARMVSQLIVKSEVGLGWGGHTIWLLQDVLVDYICASTALDIRRFVAEQLNEVNMLSLTYGNRQQGQAGIIELKVDGLFAGPMTSSPQGQNIKPSFQDMVRSPSNPELKRLLRLLVSKKPVNRLVIPNAARHGQR